MNLPLFLFLRNVWQTYLVTEGNTWLKTLNSWKKNSYNSHRRLLFLEFWVCLFFYLYRYSQICRCVGRNIFSTARLGYKIRKTAGNFESLPTTFTLKCIFNCLFLTGTRLYFRFLAGVHVFTSTFYYDL